MAMTPKAALQKLIDHVDAASFFLRSLRRDVCPTEAKEIVEMRSHLPGEAAHVGDDRRDDREVSNHDGTRSCDRRAALTRVSPTTRW